MHIPRWRLLAMVLLSITSWAAAAQPPTVTVDAASQITATTATITGTVNPNGLASASHAFYGPTTAYGYIGSYSVLGPTNAPVPVSSILTYLSPNTTYHYQLVATNSAGVAATADMTFTTAPAAGPTVTVTGALFVTSTNATISGTVNPNGLPTGYYAEWGTSTAYGQAGPPGSLPAPSTNQPVSASMPGLSPTTTYHYRLVATNGAGTGVSADQTLTTTASPPPPPAQPPTVVTGTATAITGTSASLGGSVNPNGLSTSYYFQYGTTTAYGNLLPTESAPAQSTPWYAYGTLTGLTPGVTYHYQLVASNSAGSAAGADQTFTTLSAISVDGNVFTYATNNGAITILGYSGPGGVVSIPGTVAGLPVTAIGPGAFSWLTNLNAVVIPNTVGMIGSQAFASDSGLTNVTIPNGVTFIDVGAFSDCSRLTSVTIPGSVTNIANAAFQNCSSLSSLTIANGVVTIGQGNTGMFGPFSACVALTNVTLPDSVTRLEDGAATRGGPIGIFAWCTNLASVTVGKGLAYLGTGAFRWCPNLLGVYFKGNAPTTGYSMVGDFIFDSADQVTVYYLAGTTGWGSTFAGRPTALWNAQLQTAGGAFGVQQNRFGFNIAGTPGIPVVIESSTSLGDASWAPVQTCTLTNGSVYFSDSSQTNCTARFYRVRWP